MLLDTVALDPALVALFVDTVACSEEKVASKDENLEKQTATHEEEHEQVELFDEITKDLFNHDLELRIQELESKFSKDLSETTFNELKELKKKQNIN